MKNIIEISETIIQFVFIKLKTRNEVISYIKERMNKIRDMQKEVTIEVEGE